jgi:hypothetical protein
MTPNERALIFDDKRTTPEFNVIAKAAAIWLMEMNRIQRPWKPHELQRGWEWVVGEMKVPDGLLPMVVECIKRMGLANWNEFDCAAGAILRSRKVAA